MKVISLVGLPGGGKSTVGRQLAKRIGARFSDSDAVLDELTQGGAEADSLVLATGGGALLRPLNRERLKARTTVIYLRSTPEELHRRLKHDTQRPLLQVADPLAKLRELHEQRHPLYQEVAHYTVDTGRPSVGTLVNMIVMQLDMAGLLSAADKVPPPRDPAGGRAE